MYYGEKKLLEMLKEHYKELNIKVWDAFYSVEEMFGLTEGIECYALGEKTFYILFVTRRIDDGCLWFEGTNVASGEQID